MMDLVVVGAVAVLGLVLLAVNKRSRAITAALVGGSGALIMVQVAHVHLFTPAVVLWAVFTRPPPSRQWPRVLLLATCGGLLAITVLFGDLVSSKSLALQLLALAGSAVLVALRAEADDARVMVRSGLVVITFGVLLGLLQVSHVVSLQLWPEPPSIVGRPFGIWPEPDWFGLMAAVGVVLAWRQPMRALLRAAVLTVTCAGVALSLARAAWIALAVSIVWAMVARLFAARRGERDRGGRRAGLITLGLFAASALAVSPTLRSDLGDRLATLTATSTNDVSGLARLQQTAGLLHLARTAAPFGHGLSASGRVGVSGLLYLQTESGNNVASNWLLGLWVDGALLAVPLALFLIAMAVRGVVHPPGQVLLLVLVNSLFSNALFQPVTWLFLGLTMLALPPRERKPAPAPPARLAAPPARHAVAPSDALAGEAGPGQVTYRAAHGRNL